MTPLDKERREIVTDLVNQVIGEVVGYYKDNNLVIEDLQDQALTALRELDRMDKDFIKEHYDEFLGYYYNSPCKGCPEGHDSFWKTMIESEEWKKWKASNPMYDFAECEELGIMGKEHFKAFISFIKKPTQ